MHKDCRIVDEVVNITMYFLYSVSPKFTVVPNDETVMVGEDVILTCQASGDPSPRISWDKVLGSRSDRYERYDTYALTLTEGSVVAYHGGSSEKCKRHKIFFSIIVYRYNIML